MNIFDGHCDLLYQLWAAQKKQPFFEKRTELHCSYERLNQGGVRVQTMAIFVPPEVPKLMKQEVALEMIDTARHYLASHSQINLLTSSEQLQAMTTKEESHLYILLSMEGADPLHGDLRALRTYYDLGVRSLGLTWNYRNEAADGVGEGKAAGLSNFGFQLVAEMNRLNMAIDISHLAQPGFWDCLETSSQGIMASHCNARALCDHPRNLYDDQIRAIIASKGLIGVNFVPFFLTKEKQASITDVLRHIEHMLSLGAEDCLGVGSDFDGIDETVIGLEHSAKFTAFVEQLQKHYSDLVVEKICFQNWKRYYQRLWQ